MSEKPATFEVQVYLTEEEFAAQRPSYSFNDFTAIEDAIDEHELWPEAYQSIVVARGNHDVYKDGAIAVVLYDLKTAAVACG